MRYDWPNSGAVCMDYGIKPGILMFPNGLTHVWVEFVVRLSPNFAVWAGATGGAAEYKLAVMGDAAGGIGRWNVPEMQGGQFNVGAPGPDLTIDGSSPIPSALWDGAPHVFRVEAKLGTKSDGILKFWVDGVLRVNKTGFKTDKTHRQINYFGPGLNMNQGPAIPGMQEWWHRIALYTTNPGW